MVASRQKTLLPLDDVLGCMTDAVPKLSRSALHRGLQRHGISWLPIEKRKRFKTCERRGVGSLTATCLQPARPENHLVGLTRRSPRYREVTAMAVLGLIEPWNAARQNPWAANAHSP